MASRFNAAAPEYNKILRALYMPVTDSASRKLQEVLGTETLGKTEDKFRNNWRYLFDNRPSAVTAFMQLVDVMSGGMLNRNNSLTYAVSKIAGIAESAKAGSWIVTRARTTPKYYNNYYSMALAQWSVKEYRKSLCSIFRISDEELSQHIS